MKTIYSSFRTIGLPSCLFACLALGPPRTALGQAIIHVNPIVTFQNTEATVQGVTSHRVTSFDGTLLVGTQYKAELYYLDTTTSLLTPVTATISSFKNSTTSLPGTWNGPIPAVHLPTGYGGVDVWDDGSGEAGDGTGTGPGYYPMTLQVKIWDSTTGSSWETATVRGESPLFTYTQRYRTPPTQLDTQMLTQPGFQLQATAPVAPSITVQPQSQTVMAGTDVVLSATVSGTPPLHLQWLFHGTPIVGATSATLHFSSVQLENGGLYTLTVTNAAGGTISDSARLTVLAAPTILVQPKGQTGYWGRNLTFSVVVRGSTPLTYQWFKDGVAIGGATEDTLALTNLGLSSGGDYFAVVGNSVGSVTSSPAFLLLNAAGISLGLYPGITIDGVVGNTYGVQYSTNVTHSSSWVTLTNITLTEPMQLWLDTSADAMAGATPHRSYRVVAVP